MHHKIIAIAGVLACAGVCPAAAEGQPIAHAAAAEPQATLSIRTTASRRTVARGGTIAFKIKVTNRSQTAATEVTICDQLPATVSVLIRSGGLHLFDDIACRTRATLGGGASVVLRLLARISRHARLGCDRNKARVIWSDHRARASVTYRVTASRI
jgi:uncharacterized repeat protein (TIGR01451 family)